MRLLLDFRNLNLSPYELRVKGLTEQLTNEELFAALRTISKRRGISYLDDAEDDSTGSTDYAKSIDENRRLLKTKLLVKFNWNVWKNMVSYEAILLFMMKMVRLID